MTDRKGGVFSVFEQVSLVLQSSCCIGTLRTVKAQVKFCRVANMIQKLEVSLFVLASDHGFFRLTHFL